MTSQPMKGSVVVERAGIETEPELDGWGREGIAVARRLPPER
jgi:hypothetical protein